MKGLYTSSCYNGVVGALSLLSTTLNGSEGKRSFLHDSSLDKDTCTELKVKSQRES